MAKYEAISSMIIIIYTPPGSSKSEFCNTFQDLIEETCKWNCDILIAIDFDIHWKKDFYTSTLEGTLNDNRLKQVMKEYTRIIKN